MIELTEEELHRIYRGIILIEKELNQLKKDIKVINNEN